MPAHDTTHQPSRAEAELIRTLRWRGGTASTIDDVMHAVTLLAADVAALREDLIPRRSPLILGADVAAEFRRITSERTR